jgi:ABC-type bacteriocin/lantibiotic exporter with double-glycine peptidase domain
MSDFKSSGSDEEVPPSIRVKNLTFGYPGCGSVLKDLDMTLAPGARCLLIGANGSGE